MGKGLRGVLLKDGTYIEVTIEEDRRRLERLWNGRYDKCA